MKNKHTWLVIANSIKAYIYNLENSSGDIGELHPEIPLIKTFSHEEGRMHAQDLLSDKDGHYSTPGSARGAFSEHTPEHEIQLIKFSEEIAHFLEHARTQHEYQHLIICAEPHFYGVLKKHLPDHVQDLISHHILKDYVPLQAHNLQEVIEKIKKEH
jgi:protein required for attachment to host cells